MTDQESFIERWSRLKRRKPTEPPPQAEALPLGPQATQEAASEAETEKPGTEPESAAKPLDPPPLPPLDTLGADSDYTPFLAPGVPEELRRLALRKAWSSDPAIAGFRGFAEYDWDYNAPGYGQLLPTDDIKRLCDAIFGNDGTEPPADRSVEETATARDEPETGAGEEEAETDEPPKAA